MLTTKRPGMLGIAVLAGAALLVRATPATAVAAISGNQVEVRFSPRVGPYFLSVIDLVMGLRTVKVLGDHAFRVEIGDRGDQNDYATFFASLPYVRSVRPRPRRLVSEQPPPVIGLLPDGAAPFMPAPGTSEAPFVEGQILVKFRSGVSAAQIAALNAQEGVAVLGHIQGLGVYELGLPAGVQVADMVRIYRASPLVEYAEPDYRYHIQGAAPHAMAAPTLAIGMPVSPGGASAPVPGILIDPGQLMGDSVLVTYGPGVNAPMTSLIPLVYGVRILEDADAANPARLALPRGTNPLTAARLLQLCPYVMNAEPSYGR